MHISGSLVTHPPARATDSPCIWVSSTSWNSSDGAWKTMFTIGSRSIGRFLAGEEVPEAAEGALLQLAARWPVMPHRKQTKSPAMAFPLALIPFPFGGYGDCLDPFLLWPFDFAVPPPETFWNPCRPQWPQLDKIYSFDAAGTVGSSHRHMQSRRVELLHIEERLIIGCRFARIPL